MARYEGSYAAATLVVMGDRGGFEWNDMPEYNYIDTLVYEKLKQVKVLPSDVCTDCRIHPPAIHRPDRPAAGAGRRSAPSSPTRATPASSATNWWTSSIGSPDFVEHWTNKWSDLLQVNRKFLGEKGRRPSATTSARPSPKNMPYDKFVYEHPDGQRLQRSTTRPRRTSRCCATPTRRWRTRRSCSWPCASTATSATTIRSSAGRRTSITSWPPTSRRSAGREDPNFKGQKIGGTRRRGGRAAGRDHRRRQGRRGEAPAHRHGDGRRSSPTVHADLAADRPPAAASSWRTGSLRRRTRISPRATSTACGATCWASASSSRSTTSAPAIRRPTRSCSTA